MLTFSFVIFIEIIFCSVATEWSYEFQGSAATEWSYEYQNEWPTTCEGKRQSPIDIKSTKTITKCFENFEFSSATFKKMKTTVTNTGRSVEIRFLNNTNHPRISGGGLDGEYVLDAFHFHWPSEHTINGFRYPLEGHFVYYSRKYKNLETALTHKNGVAVLTVFYKIIQSLNPAFNFVREIPLVAHRINQPVFAQVPITLKNFLSTDHDDFYRYEGSVTTPNCNEGIIWTLFKNSNFISFSQFKELIAIWDEEDEPVKSNFRFLQRLNRRQVFDAC